MPTYEYECEACGRHAEYFQSIKDPPRTECEHCKGKLRRVISASAFILKGSGWFKDAYSKPKKD